MLFLVLLMNSFYTIYIYIYISKKYGHNKNPYVLDTNTLGTTLVFVATQSQHDIQEKKKKTLRLGENVPFAK